MKNIYVQFEGMVYQQILGIPMGTNCAPLGGFVFYAPGSKDRGILFLSCLSVCLFVCLFVCVSVCLLSTLTFALTFEP